MTLEQLAAASNLTQSVLSKVENFRVTPSLPALGRIADALGVSLSELFAGLEDAPRMTIMRRDERPKIERDKPYSAIEYFALAHHARDKAITPMVLKVPCGEPRKEALPHEGEEFFLVLAGKVDLEYGRERYALKHGDSAFFDGTEVHRLVNPYNREAEVLCIYIGGHISPDAGAV